MFTAAKTRSAPGAPDALAKKCPQRCRAREIFMQDLMLYKMGRVTGGSSSCASLRGTYLPQGSLPQEACSMVEARF